MSLSYIDNLLKNTVQLCMPTPGLGNVMCPADPCVCILPAWLLLPSFER